MSLSSPTPPAVADPNAVAQNQENINLSSAEASQAGSMVNQNTPWGNISYQQTGTGPNGVPTYTATTSLDPTIANIFNTAKTGADTTLTNANYGSTTPTQAIGDMTSGLTKQMLDTETNYLSPYFSQQTSQLDAKLRNQGLAPGQPAYDQAMNGLQQSQNSTVTGFLASSQPQAFSEAQTLYNEPLAISQALLGEVSPTTVNSSGAASPGLSVQPANLIGATANAQQAQQQTYQDQVQQYDAMLSGLFSLPSTVLGGWAKGGFQMPAAAAAAA
jgi:hypothetical protein